jgi:hypothetical protein
MQQCPSVSFLPGVTPFQLQSHANATGGAKLRLAMGEIMMERGQRGISCDLVTPRGAAAATVASVGKVVSVWMKSAVDVYGLAGAVGSL